MFFWFVSVDKTVLPFSGMKPLNLVHVFSLSPEAHENSFYPKHVRMCIIAHT